MKSFKELKQFEAAREKQKEERSRLLKKMQLKREEPMKQEPLAPEAILDTEPKINFEPTLPKPVESKYGEANIPIYRDNDVIESLPSKALQQLVNLYLHAAQHGTRHIALVWP